MKTTIKKIAIYAWFLSIFILGCYTHLYVKAENEELEKQLEEAKKPTMVEAILLDLDTQRHYEKVSTESIERLTKIRNAIFWRTRCLEIKMELKIKWFHNSVECPDYAIHNPMHSIETPVFQIVEESHYETLSAFSTQNIANTRASLGLN